MDSMIERVARAICQADEQNGGAPWDFYGSDKARSNYFDSARAAIEAMREPTPDMRKACLAAVSDITVRNPKATAWDAQRAYRAMIDASLATLTPGTAA